MTPTAVTAACSARQTAGLRPAARRSRRSAISTTSILARNDPRGRSGAVATKSAASSPEIVSHASPPASWPAAITITGVISTMASELSAKLRHSNSAAAPDKAVASGSAIAATDRAGAARFLPPQRLLPANPRETRSRGSPDGWCGIRRSADDDVANPGENIAITAPSRTRPPANKRSSASPSPSAARAGHQTMLSRSGATPPRHRGQNREPRQGTCRTGSRAICSAMTKTGADDRGQNLRHQPRPAGRSSKPTRS